MTNVRANSILSKLGAIEAEMRRIGYWSANPPDLLADYQSGKRRTYLDAPTFELWLQCVFIPNARNMARTADSPESNVGIMAMRQYDYHSHVPEAQRLLKLLSEYDALCRSRRKRTRLHRFATLMLGEKFSAVDRPAPIFDSTHFPRTYRMPRWQFISYVVIGLLCFGLALTFFWFSRYADFPLPGALAIAGIGICFGLLGLISVCTPTYRVILYPDAVEVRWLQSVRRLSLESIEGYRFWGPPRYNLPPNVDRILPPIFFLVPKQADVKRLKIYRVFPLDDAFRAWIHRLPDLIARDKTIGEARIAANPELGKSPAERIARLKRADDVVLILNLAGLALVAGSFFHPHFHPIIIAAMIAWPLFMLMMLARVPSVYQIGKRRQDPRASLGTALLCSAMALVLCVCTDSTFAALNSPRQPGTYWWVDGTALLGIVLVVTMLWLDRSLRRQPWRLLVAILASLAFAGSVLTEVNILLDRSEPQVFVVAVRGKDVYTDSGGRYGWKSTTDYLTLAAWGVRSDEQRVEVPKEFYQSKQVGDQVCVRLRDGAIGIPWFVVTDCGGHP
jgi:uncharacterized protein YqcC (DUF446 family)